jgi:hypothetical protein
LKTLIIKELPELVFVGTLIDEALYAPSVVALLIKGEVWGDTDLLVLGNWSDAEAMLSKVTRGTLQDRGRVNAGLIDRSNASLI